MTATPGAAFVQRTTLAGCGLEVSRLGLGLAHLHTLADARQRTRLIDAARELGITHFDTARLYSDGLSEQTLGRALGAHRGAVTISTKFGLLPTPVIGALGPAAWPARKLRSLACRLGLTHYPQRSYTRDTLRRSLAASLKALRTDYIDIYHLHEPAEGFAPDDDVFEELEREKQKGVIRLIGVSGADVGATLERFGAHIDVVQCAEASWREDRFVPQITHSLFSGAVRGRELADGGEVRTRLEAALARRPNGAVIVQTRRVEHLRQLAAWSIGDPA